MRRGLKGNRQRFQAVQNQPGPPAQGLCRHAKAQVRNPPQQAVDGDLPLESRERRAQAEMHPHAEREVTIWLTGQGKVDNPPPDGTAPGGTIPTHSLPTVFIGGVSAQVLFSGLSPQYPGLWQIDAVVPSTTLPAINTSVVVMLDGYQSNVGGTAGANGGPGPDVLLTVPTGLITTLATK